MTKLEILSRIVLNNTKYITYAGDESNGHLIVTSDDALIFIKAAYPELYKEAFDRARAEYEARMEKEADDDDIV